MEILAGGGVWLGIAIGFVTGVAFQMARASLRNLRTVQGNLRVAKSAIPRTWVKAAIYLVGMAAYAALVVWAILNMD